MGKYDDIINMKHFVSKRYPQMSMRDRAAQFSPFAALTGYDDAIKETARLTDRKINLDENVLQKLDEILFVIRKRLDSGQKCRTVISYFEKDLKKDGGRYLDISGEVKRIDGYRNVIVLMDGNMIPIEDIMNIEIEE
jgi:hypothetical protein